MKQKIRYQQQFDNLCRLLGHATPPEADQSSLQNFDARASKFCSSDFFCFQKRVIKCLELLELRKMPDSAAPSS